MTFHWFLAGHTSVIVEGNTVVQYPRETLKKTSSECQWPTKCFHWSKLPYCLKKIADEWVKSKVNGQRNPSTDDRCKSGVDTRVEISLQLFIWQQRRFEEISHLLPTKWKPWMEASCSVGDYYFLIWKRRPCHRKSTLHEKDIPKKNERTVNHATYLSKRMEIIFAIIIS